MTEFYRKIIDDIEQHTYNGTLETFRILNRNIFKKYKKSKINNPCVENSRKKELNEMHVSLAWRTLFYLKKTILYLYTFCITIIILLQNSDSLTIQKLFRDPWILIH